MRPRNTQTEGPGFCRTPCSAWIKVLNYAILRWKNSLIVYGHYQAKPAVWSTPRRRDGGKKRGMSLWRGWITLSQSLLAQPFRRGESCWWNPNGNVEWERWGEEGQMEKQHEEWWRKEQVWRQSKTRTLKTQGELFGKNGGLTVSENVEIERQTTEMRTKQKGGLISMQCDSIHIWI